MIVLIFGGLGFLGAISLLLWPIFAIHVATAACMLIAVIAAFFLRRSLVARPLSTDPPARNDVAGRDDSGFESVADDQDSLDVAEENQRLRTAVEGLQGSMTDAASGGALFAKTVPLVERLAGIVNSKAESATLQVTENIFSITERSLSFNRQVRGLLADLFTVDQGLEKDIKRLVSIAGNIEAIVKEYRALGASYLSTLEAIETEVKEINGATSSITDLADMTNLLAINASIEAARMGEHGKGFSVIAQGVQDVSKQFQTIATKIDETAGRASDIVQETFGSLSDRAQSSVDVLIGANDELKKISTMLETQIRIVGLSLTESRDFTGEVSKELDEITVSLQFQDLISQVVQHILAILQDVESRITATFEDYSERIDQTGVELALEEIVRGKLTVREEWDAAGLLETETDVSESVDVGETAPTAAEEPQGDEAEEDDQEKADDLHGEIDLF